MDPLRTYQSSLLSRRNRSADAVIKSRVGIVAIRFVTLVCRRSTKGKDETCSTANLTEDKKERRTGIEKVKGSSMNEDQHHGLRNKN
jgi:hypothetical protein